MPTCNQCSKTFTITDADRAFYQTMQVPEPKQCPDCRLTRRLMERNHRILYSRTCDKTGKKILSQYHQNQPFPVWDTAEWSKDDWSATQYGRDFDFSRPFFEQFAELKNVVPHPAMTVIVGTLENSDFNNCVGYLKNCYLLSESDYDEECYYSNLLKQCKDIVDCSVCYNNELCYQCIDCNGSYNLKYSQDCDNCQESFFLKNCQSVSDSIACMNLRNKQYMIFNKQYTKEEYERLKAEYQLDTAAGAAQLRAEAQTFFSTQPHRFAMTKNNQNTLGDHVYSSKNAQHCFDSKDLEDCSYCLKVSLGVKSCMDYNSWGDGAELVYQSSVCGNKVYNLRFCTTTFTNVQDATYADNCISSQNIFGCVGLRQAKYCILNKQYTKEEYEALVPRVIEHMKKTGEWGEFFPKTMCSYAYNETLAQELFPKTKEEAVAAGYRWQDALPSVSGKENITVDALPQKASEIDVAALAGKILACTQCGANFKFITQELQFYKKLNIPLPTECPNCRHAQRMSLRPATQLYHRACQCALAEHETHVEDAQCPNEFETTYAPDRPEKIFCDHCYQKEVV